MSAKSAVCLTITTILLNLSILGDVNAARIDVTCEVRGADSSGGSGSGGSGRSGSGKSGPGGSGVSGSDDPVGPEEHGTIRSKVTVKGYGLPKGKYFARINSRGSSPITSRPKPATGRKVEFEFDSNLEDVIAEAKTQIPPTFIQGGTARASIRSAKTKRLIKGYMTAECRVR